jgi:Zn-dependent protease with chaperone function
MNTAVVAALAACLAFAAAGPYLARALPPAAAVRLLVPAALLAAGCGVFVLGTVTVTWLGQATEVARFVTWSPQRLHALNPIPPAAGIIAGALLAAAAAWTMLTVRRMVLALWAAHRASRHLKNPAGSPIVVVDSDELDAFTLPGLRGRIVITTGMLAALDAPGRRVLLAHEQSHRSHRHTWRTLAADLAAAINPLLRPTARAIRHATERWADEDAARITDRRLVAATVAQVALLRTDSPAASAAVAAATGGQVPQRVRALLRPAPRTRARHLGIVAVLTLAILAGTVAVERTGEALFEHAETPHAGTAHITSAPIR